MAGGKKTKDGPDQRVTQAPFNPVGTHVSETGLDVIVTLTRPETNPRATKVMVQALDQNVRFTIDDTAVTPVFGFRLTVGRDPIILDYGPNAVLQFMEEAPGATLEYVWGQ